MATLSYIKKPEGKSEEKNEEKLEAKANETRLPAFLFKAQIDAKITHLEQKDKKLSTHEAMAKFYDEIGDFIDDFVETYKGIYPLSISTEGSYCIKDPLKYFQDLYTAIDIERKPIKETFLQNQIDEIQKLVAHTIYRLKYITD